MPQYGLNLPAAVLGYTMKPRSSAWASWHGGSGWVPRVSWGRFVDHARSVHPRVMNGIGCGGEDVTLMG